MCEVSSLSQEAIGPNPLFLKFAMSSTALSSVESSSAQSSVLGEVDLHGSSLLSSPWEGGSPGMPHWFWVAWSQPAWCSLSQMFIKETRILVTV